MRLEAASLEAGEGAEIPVPPRPADLDERIGRLREALASRILVLDGATGTAMQNIELTADDFGGAELEGCNENLCATRPDVVARVHDGYLAAGADIVETNSFGSTPLVLAEYGLQREAFELNYLGIDNVLAVRGDDNGYKKPVPEGRTANQTACDLVGQIHDMNQGTYLEDGLLDAFPTNFCVGVGGYPERHIACPNMETEVRNVKAKVEAGAEYVVTQMFFNNEYYFRYVEMLREAGVTVPIIPGLKILTRKRHLSALPRTFHTEIPAELVDEVTRADDKHVREIGVEWARKQTLELFEGGAPAVHFYIMQHSKAIGLLLGGLKL